MGSIHPIDEPAAESLGMVASQQLRRGLTFSTSGWPYLARSGLTALETEFLLTLAGVKGMRNRNARIA